MSPASTPPQPPRKQPARDGADHAAAGDRPGTESALSRLLRPRATRATLVATLLTALLGFALATQVQATSKQGLDSLRSSDLVRILGDQNARAQRLDTDVRQLERTRDQLVSGQTTGKEAVTRAQKEVDALSILTGTAKASGPGITMTITQPGDLVTYANLLDLVAELRDAGAEAIQIGGARVTATTAFSSKDDALYADDTRLSAPFVVKAIGDPATLKSALEIPGGIIAVLEQLPAEVTLQTSKELGKDVVVDALQPVATPRYAQPVPAPSPSAS